MINCHEGALFEYVAYVPVSWCAARKEWPALEFRTAAGTTAKGRAVGEARDLETGRVVLRGPRDAIMSDARVRRAYLGI
jgi:hypothetical protein